MNKHMGANVVFSKFSRDFTELKNYLPIRPSEMALLNIIARRKRDLTPLALAEIMAVSKPMIAAHIQALEKNGYVYKEKSEDDKRSFFVRPTDKAVELCAKYEEKQTERLNELSEKLGDDEFCELVRLMDKAQRIIREIKRREIDEDESEREMI
ncbi:MAG: MarR family transcriptional regulator [Clostridia bacterium]|nr:MarR family transcriptional regulator [Clostridia bacterium]